MFESSELDDDDDYFKGHVHEVESPRVPSMELVVFLVVCVGAAVLLAVLCRCCCRNKTRGRVLAPPQAGEGQTAAAPYPQQQYTPAVYPAQTVTVYPVATAAYPTGAPYPAAGPYPAAVAPYPTGAPYPTTGAPYPTVAPHPTPGGPYPPAPSAPDTNAFFGIAPPGWNAQACPPSYEQVMSAEHAHKQPPYNPYAPH